MKLLEVKKLKGNLGTIHFVGIGGIGMSGIAEILHSMNYHVQGSDLSDNYNIKRLVNLGIKIFDTHAAANITNIECVVISSAISEDNPEIIEARKQGIPVIKRSEMLAELMKLKTSIAVSGTHGKTTTTTLIASMFEAAGLNPTVINGGIINSKDTNAYLGQGDFVIAEADESDATFVQIPSTIAVITNIDPEHLDFYGSFENVKAAFRNFIMNLPFYGFAVACLDHLEVKNLIADISNRRVLTYGLDNTAANIYGYNLENNTAYSVFDVAVNLNDKHFTITNIKIPVPGIHNVLNALAAIAIAVEMEFPLSIIQNGFTCFSGVKRRFTHVADTNDVTIIDDYAHHPVEINVTLKTARLLADARKRKVIAIFQPHRYSRIKLLFQEFHHCFGDADILYVSDIFPAGEEPIVGISSDILFESIKRTNAQQDIRFLSSPAELQNILKNVANPGDIMIFMGAGSVSQWANDLPEKFKVIYGDTRNNIEQSVEVT